MAWEPEIEQLKQLAQYLKDSLSGSDPSVRKNAELMLKHAKYSADINNYLAYLFTRQQLPAGLDLRVDDFQMARSAASVMLKNNVKTSYKTIPEPNKQYIKSVVLLGLQDPNAQMRSYAGNVITEIVRQGGLMGWPQILSELIALVGNESGNVPAESQEGASSALLKVCEDNCGALDTEYQGQRPLEFILSKLLEFTTHPIARIRANSLATISIFIPEKPASVMANLDDILSKVFTLANDPSEEVRKYFCRSIIQIADIDQSKIQPNLGPLSDYMIAQQSSADAELRLDAAEFWLCVAEDKQLRSAMGPYLPSVVPVLLECMIYSDDDVLRLEAEAEDAEEEDREQDIKPYFASSKSARLPGVSNGEGNNSAVNGVAKQTATGYAFAEDDLSEGEIEEWDSDGEDDPEDGWNLRKCAAASLDVFSTTFSATVFEHTLPYLKQNLDHSDWQNREAAVLALGAIADGCMDAVVPHLPDLTRFLVTLLDDKMYVVRQISCWTLGRYSAWSTQLKEPGRRQYFEPILDGLLKRLLDNNKKVQESAASAMGHVAIKAKGQLDDYLPVIVAQLVSCFSKFKDRNIFILYDCVQTLAEHSGAALAKPELVDMLMPAIMARWEKIDDQSREIIPLLECLSYIATALNQSFTSYAQPIFNRCIRMIHQNLEEGLLAANNPEFGTPEKDFLVTSLDLLSAIVQALDPQKSADLVQSSQPNLFDMLSYCMKHSEQDVRQSAYALLGDCAMHVFPQLQPYLQTLLGILIEQLDISPLAPADGLESDNSFSVVNNACWSCGEIAMRALGDMEPYVDELLHRLASILFSAKVPESLNENAALALGRLGVGCAPRLAPQLGSFAADFVRSVARVDWTDEKGHALKGFAKIVLCNPQAMEGCLLEFLMQVASVPGALLLGMGDSGPAEVLRSVLLKYKDLIGDNFDAYLNQLPPAQQEALQHKYGL